VRIGGCFNFEVSVEEGGSEMCIAAYAFADVYKDLEDLRFG